MVRNLDNRVEVAAPIYDVNIQQEIRDFLRLQFDDNTKARIINERQDNTYYDVHPENPVRAQEDIYDYLASRSRGGSR
jgi:polyphosphate kinase